MRSRFATSGASPLSGAAPARPFPLWPSAVGGVCLALIAQLAMAPGVYDQGGDSLALLFLAACGGIAFFSPLKRTFFPADERDEPRARNATTFALLCAMSVLFPLARRWTPLESLSLNRLSPSSFGWTDESFLISPAALLAIVGALLTLPATWRAGSGVVRASVLALAIVAGLALGSFWFLGRFYLVGPTEIIDPTPLAYLLQQVVEWGALVLVCQAAGAHPRARRILLRALPILLLIVWARHHFSAPPPEDE